MRIYGNLMNRIAETPAHVRPTVGMGATILYFSDRAACTVIWVSENGKLAEIQEDKAIRLDSNGQSDSQEYRYEPDPDGKRSHISLRKNGKYMLKGGAMKNGTVVMLGERDKYYDYGF